MDGLFNWKRSKQTCDSSEWIIKKECLKIFSNEREKIGVTEKLTLERNIIVAQRNEWGKNIEYHFITFWSNILLFFIKSENRRKSWIPKTFFPVNSFLSFDTFFHIQKKNENVDNDAVSFKKMNLWPKKGDDNAQSKQVLKLNLQKNRNSNIKAEIHLNLSLEWTTRNFQEWILGQVFIWTYS